MPRTCAWVLLACLSGCVVQRPPLDGNFGMRYQEVNRLESQKPCCSTLSELKFAELKLVEPAHFLLSHQSPVFVLKTGKAYVLPVALPPDAQGKTLVVRSFSSTMGGGRPMFGPPPTPYEQILVPRVSFLDAGYNLIRSAAGADWDMRTLVLRATIQPQDRYLLVHTTDEDVKPGSSPTPGGTVFNPHAPPIVNLLNPTSIVFAPVGILTLTLGAAQ